MPVFISYSQKDEAAYTMLCFALKSQRIEYWDARVMKVGASLREELREGIRQCEVCVFLATRNSIDSAWCSAELGAFWGAGIRVLVFITDPNLTEDQIPPQFKGDLWTRNVEEIIRGVESEISAAYERKLAASRVDEPTGIERPRLVSEMTVGMFFDLISSSRSNESRPLFETIILLREAFSGRIHTYFIDEAEALFDNDADAQAFALPLLNSLLGISQEKIKSVGERYWGGSFTLVTDTGDWLGFFRDVSSLQGDVEGCLLTHFDSEICDAAISIQDIGVSIDEGEDIVELHYGPVIASSGSVTLGKPSKMLRQTHRYFR